jgi:hypothetical protein
MNLTSCPYLDAWNLIPLEWALQSWMERAALSSREDHSVRKMKSQAEQFSTVHVFFGQL